MYFTGNIQRSEFTTIICKSMKHSDRITNYIDDRRLQYCSKTLWCRIVSRPALFSIVLTTVNPYCCASSIIII